MTTPQARLAEALTALKVLQSSGKTAIRTGQLPPAQLRLLLAQGYLLRTA